MAGRPVRFAVPLAAIAIVIGGSAAFAALSGNFTNREAPVPGGGALGFSRWPATRPGPLPAA
jgi:hypothetical protein